MADWLTWQVIDSAFPTGAFAHSWGLESAWQHGEVEGDSGLRTFLQTAILQAGRGVLPLLNAAHENLAALERLDALANAFLANTVANRASRVQGRALVATCARVWPSDGTADLKRRAEATCAHFAPFSGAAMRAIGLSLPTSQHVALYGTVRGVLAAAVRLGITGSFHAQRLQHECSPWLDAVAERCSTLRADDLAQAAPIADLLQSAHDRLYSRLFQS